MTDENISATCDGGESIPGDGGEMTPASLPATISLRQNANGKILANSRDLAERFGRRHKNVLRSIYEILHGSLLSHVKYQWFIPVLTPHPTVSGRFDESFDMTLKGVMHLTRGWNCATELFIEYMEAFDAMEEASSSGRIAAMNAGMTIEDFEKTLAASVTPIINLLQDVQKRIEADSHFTLTGDGRRVLSSAGTHVIEKTAARTAVFVAEDFAKNEGRLKSALGNVVKNVTGKQFRESDERADRREDRAKVFITRTIEEIPNFLAKVRNDAAADMITAWDAIEIILGKLPFPMPRWLTAYVSTRLLVRCQKNNLPFSVASSRPRVLASYARKAFYAEIEAGLDADVRQKMAERSNNLRVVGGSSAAV